MLQKILDKFSRKQFSHRDTAEAKCLIEVLEEKQILTPELSALPEKTYVEIWRKLRSIYTHKSFSSASIRHKMEAKNLLNRAGDFF